MFNVIVQGPEPQKPVMTMLVPGRRALSEPWQKINVRPDPESGGYALDKEPTEAPADGNPIFVPGLGNLSVEMADFILESKRHEAMDRATRPRQGQSADELNRLWHDYVEQKLRWFKGQSTFGPGGSIQRERIPHGK